MIARGISGADRNFVQVQLTEFAIESFPLAIGWRGADRNIKSNEDGAVQGLLDLGDAAASAPSSLVGGGEAIGRRQSKGPRFGQYQTRDANLASAACLSIIGMIKPGRTVRLYRQIH